MCRMRNEILSTVNMNTFHQKYCSMMNQMFHSVYIISYDRFDSIWFRPIGSILIDSKLYVSINSSIFVSKHILLLSSFISKLFSIQKSAVKKLIFVEWKRGGKRRQNETRMEIYALLFLRYIFLCLYPCHVSLCLHSGGVFLPLSPKESHPVVFCVFIFMAIHLLLEWKERKRHFFSLSLSLSLSLRLFHSI